MSVLSPGAVGPDREPENYRQRPLPVRRSLATPGVLDGEPPEPDRQGSGTPEVSNDLHPRSEFEGVARADASLPLQIAVGSGPGAVGPGHRHAHPALNV